MEITEAKSGPYRPSPYAERALNLIPVESCERFRLSFLRHPFHENEISHTLQQFDVFEPSDVNHVRCVYEWTTGAPFEGCFHLSDATDATIILESVRFCDSHQVSSLQSTFLYKGEWNTAWLRVEDDTDWVEINDFWPAVRNELLDRAWFERKDLEPLVFDPTGSGISLALPAYRDRLKPDVLESFRD